MLMMLTCLQVLISYYQWVPLILLFQAMLAFVPCLVWRFVNKRSGVNMAAIMDAARHSSQAHYLEIREKVRIRAEFSFFFPWQRTNSLLFLPSLSSPSYRCKLLFYVFRPPGTVVPGELMFYC